MRDTMDDRQDFIKRINELTEIALDQENVIFEEQLFSIFPEVQGDKAKYDVIKEYLTAKKIGLNDKLPMDVLLTQEEKNYLDFYLEELNDKEALTKGQREAYMLSAMAGDESARALIMEDTLKNVVEIAKLYVGQGVLLEDLIGEGNLSLVNAVMSISTCEDAAEAEGVLASAIMDAMQDLIAEGTDTSGAEEKLLKRVNKVSKAAAELAEALGRKVTIEELMEETGMTRSYIEAALKLTANAIEDIEIPDDLK